MASTSVGSVENAFVEQAEYIDDTLFSQWLVQHPNEDEILRKLKASGAKLLTGPRGTGKTTLMLRARNQMMRPNSEVLPAYVNFKTSLRLEPLYRTSGNASFWFKQWLLLRTAVGLAESSQLLGLTLPWQALSLRDGQAASRAIEALQVGSIELAASLVPEPITTQALVNVIRRTLGETGRTRAVLLFDDAAHAFSSEQQRDFFDFFREVKSPFVSPKAAIYPGVTDFSPSFHVGHDAEEVNVWLDPSDANYLAFMASLLEKRLPGALFSRIKSDQDALNVIALAAFGVPRNFLNMIRDAIGDAHGTQPIARSKISKAVNNCAETSLKVFKSLQKKLPIYARFIENGEDVVNRSIAAVKEYNTITTKAAAVTVALAYPVPSEVKTLFSFLQYAGLVRPRGDVKRGEKGTFWLLDVHYALLIEANAVVPKKSVGLNELADRLSKRDAHAFARITAAKLLGSSDIAGALPLMLPPCNVCQTERATPTAKFCLNCGSPLTVSSTFEIAVMQDLAVLPLTLNRVRSIKQGSSIRTVKDVLLDKDHTELLRVHMIGPVWATRISRYAEEFVE
ncbi:hypothetical protein [Roseateles sp. P5_E7]